MSNFPLRGGKAELWEGGVRGACFFAGGALPRAASGTRSSALLHASDLFPTLLAIAGVPLPSRLAPHLYGVDASRLLMEPMAVGRYDLRSELLHNADPISGRSALRVGDFKLLSGEPPSGWGPDPRAPLPSSDAGGSSSTASTTSSSASVLAEGPDTSWWARQLQWPGARELGGGGGGGGGALAPTTASQLQSPGFRLFDVVSDPEERHDLAAEPAFADRLAAMKARLAELEAALSVPVRKLSPDPNARPQPIPGLDVCTPSPVGPILCGVPLGIWQPWQPDDEDPNGSNDGSLEAQDDGSPPAVGAAAATASARHRVSALMVAAAFFAAGFVIALTVAGCWLARRGGRAAAGPMARRLASQPIPTSADEDDRSAADGPSSPSHAEVPRSRRKATTSAQLLRALYTSFCGRGLLLAAGGAALLAAALLASALVFASLLGRGPLAALAWPSMELGDGDQARREPPGGGVTDSPPSIWPAGVVTQIEWRHPHAATQQHAAPPPPSPAPRRRNIVLILTDDQDQILGGGFVPGADDAPTPMPRTRTLLGEAGATAANFFAHTPICCPSRAEMLTGLYLHNLAVDPSDPPREAAEDCMHVDGRRVNNRSFAMALQAAGYRTALFGKYLNRWPMRYAPEGFDAFLGNGGGTYLSPRFVARGMGWFRNDAFGATDETGGIRDGHWQSPAGSYSTAIIGNATAQWIRAQVGEQVGEGAAAGAAGAAGSGSATATTAATTAAATAAMAGTTAATTAATASMAAATTVTTAGGSQPWFAMMATRAAHEPFVPASWYAQTWHSDWPAHEPRPPSWNHTAGQHAKHGNLQTQRPLTSRAASVVTGVFRNRWRTLLSVDDAVAAVVDACGPQLDDTFLIFTSDHGFTLGEFGMLMDKRHAYDFDTRVPLLVRGPGIAPRTVMEQMATHVDLAPTILEMAGVGAQSDGTWRVKAAGVPPLVEMDGHSMLPLLLTPTSDEHQSARRRWRTSLLIEHLYWDANVKCVANCSFDNPPVAAAVEQGVRVADEADGACGPDKPRRCPLSSEPRYPLADLWCGNLAERRDCWQTPWSDKPSWHPRPMCTQDCYPTESEENSFAALRRLDGTLYVEGGIDGWRGGAPDWAELYASDDPWQLSNRLLRATTSATTPGADGELIGDAREAQAQARQLSEELRTTWVGCRGAGCP